ncbi:hypothetical protein C343_06861 [Cryptococcus neoformans C23]|uniref:Protein PNS1 n=1 Tax=Cryptococcus neoformans (strain H99 / ATCC 208821 / CBS 10515 / FGSC 9487) TaxID=235443 RepID=J9VZJ3_CRYN9|nr:hypothetical protein CNAG_05443 [Cryptococcus neoformans var. grubii H99]AUB29081.1 hypothetical protein CKF44_05443 [Cryptococcus neoformans var. grubii]OWZ26394.1 hypothetical protein C347_06788 [Cryptococcus neoformans var. grubii AD2-60a]OWZ38441.1 hypothetical protein C343_06861 [Cryptococcus neoformans var. grubii C23]OXC81009.1 hypothetical protein C344_06763 [Cryptococcus neoformans var. grubii AD1-7a]OXG25990.1 hypothetical protein C360_07052 [Cryptococcus neoformans var. grubii Bt|eukprot:XP_012053774.1 hypothetical protein CNAG_05443 [Cryptococcus neoformans var. grubii H99]
MATDYDDLSDIDVPGNWTVTTSEVKRVKRTEIDFDQAFNKSDWFQMVVDDSQQFVRQFPTFVIFLGPVVTVLYLLAAAGGCAYLGVWSEATICVAIGAIVVGTLFLLKNHYRLARDILDTANKAAKAHWSVFWTVLIGSIIQCVNAIWNVFTFTAVFLRFEPWHKGCDDGYFCSASLTWVLLVFVVLEYVWISGVISNIILSVMAGGPYAHWWYGTDLDTRSESIWALKRAVGTSLGSIAFGSLLVTAIEVLHFVLKLFSGGYMGKFDLAPHDSVMLMRIESWLKFFNKYVYIRIGVDRFEIGFIQGGKEVWRLFKKGRKLKRQGIAALVNDSVVGVALHVSCIGNAVLCAGLSYLYMTTINGSFHIDHWWDWLILLYSFILALNIGLSLTSALEAGVSTIFVCLDKDPEYLKDRNPRFYQDLACHPTYFQAVMPEATKPLSPNEKV